MRLGSASPAFLLLAVAPLAITQQPSAPTQSVDVASALQRALVGSDALAMGSAVGAVMQAGKEGRARLRTLLERVAPAAAALPKPDAKPGNEPLDDSMIAIVEGLVGDDAGAGDAAAAKLVAAAETATEPVRKVVARSNTILTAYMQRVFRDNSASGAIFAGQYAPFRELGPQALEIVTTWMEKPPPGANAAVVRGQCQPSQDSRECAW